ncbi:Ribosome_biogenesis regulatory protein (RRS1) [Hexamita inflata]|uniref:Ribosome biogenesis regulatory protein n=1 Tax=Hexamita inflata TaxID=28002 RepID=A0AA86PMH6_9EUKA|nr:Ribosome biogenesis regulatory protein (RRS1) [Hexamita inflata]
MNDLYYLTALNFDPIPEETINSEFNLMQYTSNNLKSLFEEFAQLKSTQNQDGWIYDLPKPIGSLPREKSLPKPKPQTKWEKFAAEKGIQKRKKDRLTYDEQTGKYKPRNWRKNNDDPIRDAKPGVADPFLKEAEAKKQNLAKQKKHQLGNIQYQEKSKLRAAREEKLAQQKRKNFKGGRK